MKNPLSSTPVDEELHEGIFKDTVRQLGALTGRGDVEVRVSRQRGARARCYPRPQITVGLDVLERSAAAQQWTAAHEMAHALGHPVSWVHRYGISACFVVASACMVPLFLGSGASVVGTYVAMIGLALTGCLWYARVTQGREIAADLQAAAWGYPMPEDLVMILIADEKRHHLNWLPQVLRTHPRPEDRAAMTRLRGQVGRRGRAGLGDRQRRGP